MHGTADRYAYGEWLLVAVNVGLVLAFVLSYSMSNPQYGVLFLLIGSMLVQWPSLSSWLMTPVLILTYVRLARREEREASEQFGERYLAYRARTPAFVPAWRWLRQRPVAAPETRP